MLLKLFLYLTIFFTTIGLSSAEPGKESYILYLMQSGNTTKALQVYKDLCKETKSHNFELIQQMGLILLDQGYRSKDPEIQLLTLFGAGISLNEKALYILEDGIKNHNPQLQLIALNFLARYQNDEADVALNRAMSSNYLIIRLEAAYHLAAKKSPNAVGQTESLMSKVNDEALGVFSQLFGMIGDHASIKLMRKLLTNPQEMVRVDTILSAAKYQRDDLLPQIRRMATHHDFAQQEACAYALGELKDESSIPKLQILAKSQNTSIKLAALQALYRLGKTEVRAQVENLAKSKDLYAITLLGGMEGSEKTLYELIKDSNIQVRINAAIALLELNDPKCLIPLCDIFIRDSRDLILLKSNSLGKSLSSWKVVSSASENFSDIPLAFEVSLGLREGLLAKTLELPEKNFLQLAHTLFEAQQNDLVPALTELLENLQTPLAIELLKIHQQKAGAPLVRNYCNLALYKLKQPGPYAKNLQEWVTKQQNVDLIKFRPFQPMEMRELVTDNYQLTPQETSRLLVEAFDSYISSQDDKGIDVLINILQSGNSKNKYALIGLLMRATQ